MKIKESQKAKKNPKVWRSLATTDHYSTTEVLSNTWDFKFVCVKIFLWKFCFGFQNTIKIPDPLCSFPFKDERLTDFGLSMSMVLNKKDQNAIDIITKCNSYFVTKCDSYFITKCEKSLLQKASPFFYWKMRWFYLKMRQLL